MPIGTASRLTTIVVNPFSHQPSSGVVSTGSSGAGINHHSLPTATFAPPTFVVTPVPDHAEPVGEQNERDDTEERGSAMGDRVPLPRAA